MNLILDKSCADLVASLRELEPEFRSRGITHLAIFGSRARGDNKPESDPDVLIDVDSVQKFSLLDLVGAAHVIEDSIGVSANIFMRRILEPQFAASIKPDVIDVF